MRQGNKLIADFPEKLVFLFQPCRYKVALGGRGSGKSWSFARALLILGIQKPIRVLCTREVQNSIKDSVHKLLKEQVELMGMTDTHYQVLETMIRGTNGTEFLFSGLSTQTVESIKSFEGCDYCWIEEAQNISKRSYDVLIPTIRKDGSEIWISFNPDLETDETFQRFVVDRPEDCIVVNVNYNDNPWFNQIMENERLHCKKTDPDGYENIWEGKCRPAVEGAIYYKEIESAENQNRICNVPYDQMLKVHVVVDIGWNDAFAISLVQKHSSEIRIIEYIEDSHKTLDFYSSLLKEKKYNWGKVWLPHDGFSGDVKTGKSVADIFRALGWDVPTREEIAEVNVEGGIKLTRMAFSRLYFDKSKTDRLVQCAKRYRRVINKQTGESSKPMHDEWSHGADCLRYVCVNIDNMTNEADVPFRPVMVGYGSMDSVIGY